MLKPPCRFQALILLAQLYSPSAVLSTTKLFSVSFSTTLLPPPPIPLYIPLCCYTCVWASELFSVYIQLILYQCRLFPLPFCLNIRGHYGFAFVLYFLCKLLIEREVGAFELKCFFRTISRCWNIENFISTADYGLLVIFLRVQF